MDKPPCLQEQETGPGGIIATVIVVGGTFAGLVYAGVLAGEGFALLGAAVFFAVALNSPDCSPGGYSGCVAGVVNNIDLAGEDSGSIFPWREGHPNVQLVTKSIYWPFLIQPDGIDGPEMEGVRCTSGGRHSPYIVCRYKSDRVCRSHAGALAGGVIGGVGGLYVGILIMAAVACTNFITCLIGAIIAAIAATVVTIISVIIGGQAGAASAGSQHPEDSEDSVEVRVGDFVTLKGKFQDEQSVLVGHFVQETSIHGSSMHVPPFFHGDLDTEFTEDNCPVPEAPQ
jgi:hypothetical protein